MNGCVLRECECRPRVVDSCTADGRTEWIEETKFEAFFVCRQSAQCAHSANVLVVVTDVVDAATKEEYRFQLSVFIEYACVYFDFFFSPCRVFIRAHS